MEDIADIRLQFDAELLSVDSLKEVDILRLAYIGKKGRVKMLFSCAPAQNKTAYLQSVNSLFSYISSGLSQKREAINKINLQEKIEEDAVDITYPIRPENYGIAHPINESINDVLTIFNSMGFEHVSGPEIEDEYHVFDALNTPLHHPARQMQDTFYLKDGRLLRTHTSSVQIREMLNKKPPFYIISIGRVYRRDWDATHTPMFHQVEGLCIDERINMCNMKYCINAFLNAFFKDNLQTRMRPSYFPFTEPSAEVDVMGSDGNWLEILGCGMVHTNVLANVGVDSAKYQGFAFGIGIERLTMIKNRITDLRDCFSNDLRWLQIYGIPV